ncbi:uncharacterized protein LOC127250707 [Andrographis paniculata]|uniref:uncharacterized protein LOC127250707 n=1 Tax=Andrographis paniculata TaxID=175694 RepID=UPI0021E7267D|nr:uncharacterized protein LOC127250707 [Andrographis paniculata]
MAATVPAAGSCGATVVFSFAPQKPAPFSKHVRNAHRCSTSSSVIALRCIGAAVPCSVSSPESAAVVDEDAEERETSSDDEIPLATAGGSVTSLAGCKACGRDEIENGCNGEGRIQGGIATVPGFGWWPIKAYRPCPAYLASGGRYRRSGQSMDEVVSGRGRKASERTEEDKSRKKKVEPKVKR